jgi:putative protease
VRLGVLSYKIEGRLKEPEYVAAITRIYRKAIDAAAAAESGNGKPVLSKRDRYTMEMVFSRGLYSGWMHGVNHQELVHGEFGKKRGPFVGTVLETGPDYVHLDTIRCPLKPGDGVVFENPADTNREQGGRLFHIQGARLTFGRSLVDLRSVRPGTRVWKTDDPALQAELRKTYAGRLGMRALPVNATIRGAAGEAFVLELETPEGIRATAESRTPLQPARNRPLTPESVRAQIERFGEFPFKLGDSYFHLQGEVILPISEINDVRRRAAEALWRRLRPARREYISDDRWKSMLEEDVSVAQPAPAQEPELAVLCRTQEHVETCIAAGIRRIYLDFEDVRRYASAVDHVRSTHPNVEVFLATPRIQKSGEQGFFRLIENAHPHGVLVRNLGAISFFRESPLTLVGDFSLNAANPLTVGWFMRKGMSAVTISYDLNEEQVLALVRSVPAAWLELTLHQHMPLFHMEHCVFAAFMSNGRDFTDCGRPCEKHRVHLRDRTGVAHPLRADAGCRNTLFHATPQTGASMYETFLSAGLRRFRVELLEETGRDLGRILDSYQALIRGEISGTGLWKKLHASNRLGVTRGTLVSGTRSV